MPSRRVAVNLELEVARYNRGAADALTVTRRVEASIHDLGDEADDTSRDMDQLAANTDLAKRQVDDLGDEARGSARDLAALERQMHQTTAAALAMAAVPSDPWPGSTAGVGDGHGRGATASFAAGGAGAGGAFANAFHGALSTRMFGVPGPLIAGLVAVVAAALPAIGAMIGGAVTGAVGLGGIAGGIAAASKDPAVRRAASEFGPSISTMFFGSGSAFVTPITRSLDILKEGFRDLDLESVFAKVAPFVSMVAAGIADMGREFMPAFGRALDAARPALVILARELPNIGRDLGYMFETIAKSKGTMQGLLAFFHLIEAIFRGTGNVIRWLADRFYDLNQFMFRFLDTLAKIPGPGQDRMKHLRDEVEEFIRSADSAGRVTGDLSVDIFDLGATALSTGDALTQLLQHTRDYYEYVTAQRDTQIALEQGLDDLTEAVKNHGTSLDIDTQAGRDNVRILADLEAQAKRNYEDNVRNGMNTATATILYDQQIKKVQEQAENLGIAEQKTRDLLDAWRQVVEAPNAVLRLQFELSGTLLGEQSGLRLNERRQPNLPEYVPLSTKLRLESRAAGGPVLAGQWYRVNEQRQEFFRPAMDGWVAPLGSPSVAPTGAGGGADFDYDKLAAAMAQVSLHGVAIMDSHAVGELVDARQAAYAAGGPRP